MKSNKIINIIIIFIAIIILSSTLVSNVNASLIVNKYSNDFSLESPFNEQIKTCSCESKTDSIIVTNQGNFLDNYHLKIISPVNDWIKTPETDFILAPGHSKEVSIYITAPCKITGTYDYTVEVSSEYGRVEYLKRTIRSDKCQNLETELNPKKATINYCEELPFNIKIKNPGTFGEEYKISLGKYDSFANLTRDIYLLPDQEKDVVGRIRLPCDYYGKYEIPVKVHAVNNNINSKEKLVINVENQFDHSIITSSKEEVCAQVSQEIPVTIKNKIDLDNEFTIKVSGANFVDVKNNERKIKLGPNENKTIFLIAKPSKKDLGNKEIEVEVKSKLGKISRTKKIIMNVNDCYDFDFDIKPKIPNKIIDKETEVCCGEKEYYLNIKNNGLSQQSYNIMIDAPSWFKSEELSVSLNPNENKNVKILAEIPCVDKEFNIPVTLILNSHPEVKETKEFKINSLTKRSCHAISINKDELQIKEGEPIIIELIQKGIEGGLYKLNIDDELVDYNTEFQLKAGETKNFTLQTNNISSGRHIIMPTITYEGKTRFSNNEINNTEKQIEYIEHVGIYVKAKNKILLWIKERTSCQWSAIILLIILLITTIAVFFIKKIRRVELTRKILGIIILLLLFVTIMIYPANNRHYIEPQNSDDYFIIMNQGVSTTINISNYFTDPDDDFLSYSAIGPENIVANIKGETLTLTPDEGFSGEDKLIIVANDNKGGVNESPELPIYVMKKKIISTTEWWSTYCAVINLSLLMLITFVLFIGALFMKNKPGDYVITKKGKIHKKDCYLVKTIPKENLKESYKLLEKYDKCKRCLK